MTATASTKATRAWGISGALTATLVWGAMFPVAASVLPDLGPYWMTFVRYLGATPILLVALRLVEGAGALRPDGRTLRLLGLGTLGFAGFNLLTFEGVAHSRPQNISLVVALTPLLTLLVTAVRTRRLPGATTLGWLLLALLGVAVVLTHGHPAALGSLGVGEPLALVGAICWIVYSLGAAGFPAWSPLRYTTLTMVGGTIGIGAVTTVATAVGHTSVPPAGAVWDAVPQLAYMSVLAGTLAVVGWNTGVRNLGALNGVLFMNLVPITTFTVEGLRGSPVTAVDLIGVAITIAALVGENLGRRRTARNAAPAPAPSLAREFEEVA
ncbi:MAG: DMT family transporter [Mycobacteriales bacterium]